MDEEGKRANILEARDWRDASRAVESRGETAEMGSGAIHVHDVMHGGGQTATLIGLSPDMARSGLHPPRQLLFCPLCLSSTTHHAHLLRHG